MCTGVRLSRPQDRVSRASMVGAATSCGWNVVPSQWGFGNRESPGPRAGGGSQAKGAQGSKAVIPGLGGRSTHLHPGSGQAVQTVPVGPEGGGGGRECREKQQQGRQKQGKAHWNLNEENPKTRSEPLNSCATSGPGGWPCPRVRPRPARDHASSSGSLHSPSDPYFPSRARD